MRIFSCEIFFLEYMNQFKFFQFSFISDGLRGNGGFAIVACTVRPTEKLYMKAVQPEMTGGWWLVVTTHHSATGLTVGPANLVMSFM